MLKTAGFETVDDIGRFQLVAREGWKVRHSVLKAHKPGSPYAKR